MQHLKREQPSAAPIRFLQFGGGNFLRAFANWMIDELNQQTDFQGDVAVVKPTLNGNYKALREQDGLFQVWTRGYENGEIVEQVQVIRCVQQIIHPYQEWAVFLNSAIQKDIRFIISNTTEAGIRFRAEPFQMDEAAEEFPAKLTQWFYHRFQYFDGALDKGCIVLPCELIEQNGDELRNCVAQYAEHWKLPTAFQVWLDKASIFCNTLVDRIVTGYPETTDSDRLHPNDKLLVEAEPYHFWAIEANEQVQQELPFAQTNLNIVFTNDLTAYRTQKVRILNGAHTAMVPIGYLANLKTVQEAIESRAIGQLLQNLVYQEIIPTLAYPKQELEAYAQNVWDRFRNPFLNHQLIDISLNAIPKFKARLLPSLEAYVTQFGTAPEVISQALAAYIYFYRGRKGEEKIPLKASNEVIQFFQEVWNEHAQNLSPLVENVLAKKDFWGKDLNELADLNTKVLRYLEAYNATTKK